MVATLQDIAMRLLVDSLEKWSIDYYNGDRSGKQKVILENSMGSGFKCHEKLSNTLFVNLIMRQFEFPPDMTSEMWKVCNVTKVNWIYNTEPMIVYGFELKELRLMIPSRNKDAVLKIRELLNQKSADKLKRLVIEFEKRRALSTDEIREALEGCRELIEENTPMLPMLQELALIRCDLSNDVFEFIHKNCPTLKKLNISFTNLTDLTGISVLENLESLALEGIIFEKKEDLMEIFELKKLKDLDLSMQSQRIDFGPSRARFDNLKYFRQCMDLGKALPELKYIDCSYNAVDETEERPFNIPNRNVDFLMVNDLASTLEYIEFYNSHDVEAKESHALFVFFRMGIIYIDNNMSEMEIRRSVDGITMFMKKHSYNGRILYVAAFCLHLICRYNDKYLTTTHRQSIIEHVLFPKLWTIEHNHKLNIRYHCSETLVSKSMIDTPGIKADIYCRRAADLLMECDFLDLPFESCMHILCEFLEDVTEECYLKLSGDNALKLTISEISTHHVNPLNIAVLIKLLNCRGKENKEISRNYVQAFANTMREYRDYGTVVMLGMLEETTLHLELNPLNEIFPWEIFAFLEELLASPDLEIRRATASLLVTLYHQYMFPRDMDDSVRSEKKEDLISKIVDSVEKNVKDAFRHIKRNSKHPQAVLCMNWILVHYV
ncbi:hypothetical protein GCK72_003707 [Caenorhabditis remanei]|uniref:Uncharacterized protein n=1 Tax=Caenorhabditis remanei TaxID=31234 RepID=A0A6A5HBJ0_CAERE|nr:hypothetical protein GCK72_003707 [Caenorhabditis remanei]KAF1763762.1 hypothetical protein GCK72_003707 [Caenorhabditis remanei]